MRWRKYVKKKNLIEEYKLIDVFVFLSLLFLALLYLKEYHVPYLNTDEHGYWGSAAFFSGYDWSNVISTNGFFSWGYGLILSVFLKIFPGGMLKFKFSILLNALFLFLLYIVLQKINLLINKNLSTLKNKFICMIGAFYCSCVAYVGFSLPECLLTLLFGCMAYLMLLYLKTNSYKYAVLLILLSLYSYMVHQRTIVLLMVNFAFILLSVWKNKKKEYKKILITMLGLFLIIFVGILFHEYIKGRVIAVEWKTVDSETGKVITSQTTKSNNYSGIMQIVKYVFSEKGIKELFIGVMGKFYYVICSTFGTVLIFFINKIKETFRDVKSGEITIENEFAAYLFFCICGVLAVSAVATVSVWNNSTYLFYGRYTDNVIPVILCLSLSFLLERQEDKNILYSFSIAYILGKIMLSVIFCSENYTMLKTTISQVGVSMYYDRMDRLHPSIAVIVPAVLSILFFFRNCMPVKKMLFLIFLIYNCMTGYRADFLFTVEETLDNIDQVIDVAEYIKNEDIERVTVITRDNGRKDKYAKIIQFLNPELYIELKKYDESNPEEYYEIVISHRDKTFSYEILYQNSDYIIYQRKLDMEYVNEGEY